MCVRARRAHVPVFVWACLCACVRVCVRVHAYMPRYVYVRAACVAYVCTRKLRACVCVRARVYALRIDSTDKILSFSYKNLNYND